MNGKYKALWLNKNDNLVVLDQRILPFVEKTITITNTDECVKAIKNMTVRGAGVIGNTAAFGVFLASCECNGDLKLLEEKAKLIRSSRPTAVNLMWAVDRMMEVAKVTKKDKMQERLKQEAIKICDEDCKATEKIANFGADIFEEIMKKNSKKEINVLTHCNAGWLAIVDSGTALAPIYEAQKRGIKIHVWVDETRPRNQGANLTAWELEKGGIDHTVIADNTGGHLMQHGLVDVCITGADRVSLGGDVANKIGTYLKALAASDNNIPFYVALPSSTFDFKVIDGIKEIDIEIRGEDEVKMIRGVDEKGQYRELQIVPTHSKALNYGFDVTPSRLITGLITERGVCKADIKEIQKLYKDIL